MALHRTISLHTNSTRGIAVPAEYCVHKESDAEIRHPRRISPRCLLAVIVHPLSQVVVARSVFTCLRER